MATTTLPIGNDSMARAMTHRTIREAPEQQRMAINRACTEWHLDKRKCLKRLGESWPG